MRSRAASPSRARWCSGWADNLGLIGASPEIETLPRTVEDNGGVYFVSGILRTVCALLKHNARGVIAGLTRYVNKGTWRAPCSKQLHSRHAKSSKFMEQDSGIALMSCVWTEAWWTTLF